MIFVAISICVIFLGLILIFINFFKYDKDFKCDWKRYKNFFNLSFPAIVSFISSTIILIGSIVFISLSFLLETDTALIGLIIFSAADIFTIGNIKTLFWVIDRVRYNLLLTKYIQRTFDVEKNVWQPEDPIKAADAIFEYKDIKKRIEKMTQERQKHNPKAN